MVNMITEKQLQTELNTLDEGLINQDQFIVRMRILTSNKGWTKWNVNIVQEERLKV